jgi:hydroxymethylpyrimidine kinase/phosphomethylpyrimidine kinase/thiamine-phosphate diphosphorylase
MTRKGLAERIKGVYLVTDHGEKLVERVSSAIGRIAALQFRSKTHHPAEKLQLGRQLRDLCSHAGVLFIVNDDCALAAELDADGVHLGQDDGDIDAARKILGPGKLVGISTHNLAEALAAQSAGADYLGFGAMFPTASKEIGHLAGPELLASVRGQIAIPIVAIGGINRDNGAAVIDAGADAVAVIAAVMSHREPLLAATELRMLFNRRQDWPRGVVLTVAGSDSGGGAGIQADLKTVTLLGSYGASVITALTAQNTLGVAGIQAATPDFVAAQLDAVLGDIPVDVIKTGMLFSAAIIRVLAEKIVACDKKLLVVDPVMIAKGGSSLIDDTAVAAFKSGLLPLTYLLTPNVPEAEALAGIRIIDEKTMERCAEALHLQGARNVLIKGGHMAGGESVDLLFDGHNFSRYSSARLESLNTHGTGCTLASAIAVYLAQGEPLPVAIGRAKKFISEAIRLARPLGQGHGPVNHYAAAREMRLKEY